MKVLVALLAALAALAGPDTHAQANPDVLGEWWTPGFNARVRIEPCGEGAVCGRIVWLWDDKPQGIADKSPLIGKPVIERMRQTDTARWTDGRLYNPEDGRDYKGSLTLRSSSTLVVDGCFLFICQTQVWRRMDPNRSPPVALP